MLLRGEVVQIATICNQRAGGLYRDAKDFITPELVARFDAIARSMPEFHYGRFDVRFASVDTFAYGEDFAIVEVNGIGGEAIDVGSAAAGRDLPPPAGAAFLFMIGERNRARGFVPTPVREFVGLLAGADPADPPLSGLSLSPQERQEPRRRRRAGLYAPACHRPFAP